MALGTISLSGGAIPGAQGAGGATFEVVEFDLNEWDFDFGNGNGNGNGDDGPGLTLGAFTFIGDNNPDNQKGWEVGKSFTWDEFDDNPFLVLQSVGTGNDGGFGGSSLFFELLDVEGAWGQVTLTGDWVNFNGAGAFNYYWVIDLHSHPDVDDYLDEEGFVIGLGAWPFDIFGTIERAFLANEADLVTLGLHPKPAIGVVLDFEDIDGFLVTR
jgi:hypothetical protein